MAQPSAEMINKVVIKEFANTGPARVGTWGGLAFVIGGVAAFASEEWRYFAGAVSLAGLTAMVVSGIIENPFTEGGRKRMNDRLKKVGDQVVDRLNRLPK